MPTSFYERGAADVFVPTDFTIGPWSKDAQHGGPPAALLGRAIEREAGPDKQIVRLTFDILGPVPISPLSVDTRVVRPGKRVALIESSLSAGGVVVMRASAWAIRCADIDVPELDEPPPEGPDGLVVMDPSEIVEPTRYLHATEWRFLEGGFLEPGPAIAWLRTRVPLVDGEADSPLVKVLAVADSASGVSGALDFNEWLYINTDLSVYLHRMPEGEWIRIDAATAVAPSGVAVASGVLSDRKGRFGTTSQALFVAPREA
jgi:hypothetical protein